MSRKPEPFFPPPTLDNVPAKGMVRITAPNEMGEIVDQEVVPADHLSKPKPKERRKRTRDPLAGQRERINNSEVEYVLLEDQGKGCPVKPGDIFKLRSCHIEITRTHRVTKDDWAWRAEFRRHYAEAGRHLKRGGGYTSSPHLGVPDPETNTEPESVPRDFQRRISEEAALSNARAAAAARKRAEKLELEGKLVRERPKGRVATIIAIETRISRLSEGRDAA